MTRFVGLRARRAVTAVVLAATPRALVAQAASDGLRSQTVKGLAYSLPSPKSSAPVSTIGAPVSITIEGGARRMLVGATVPHTARLRDASGAERRDVLVQWSSSDPNIASVNQFGVMTAVRPGPVTIRASAGSLSAERKYAVEANPVKSLTLSITADHVKTGDVVEVSAMAFDANGYKVPNVPFLYTFTAAVEDTAVGQLAPAELDQKGRFVAQKAGDYQIIAVAPGLVAHRTVRVANRDIAESARLIARAPAPGSQLTDVFAWRGRDGRDFALACGAGNRAQIIAYELAESDFRALDTVSVDARSVSDCVVDSETGVAAVVRDGANGRSSIALFDVTDPRSVKPLGTFDDAALGAISGVAMYRKNVVAVSDAHRLEVVSIDDPARPRRAASFELGADYAGPSGTASATDVTISDGIAYVALGRLGMVMVDVGNGKFGGSPTKPARVGGFHAPFSSTHAAYGYRSRTGKWYAIMSEDLLPTAGIVQYSASSGQPGFARIVDVTDPAHPEEVARYEVPETGVQDLWVDGERLYVAAQSGGVRVVDISSDLKGNLYHQGREIARYVGADGGPTPNVVAVQPIRGGLLAADRATGVWMVKLMARD
jgi:hypothetical protein